LNANNYVLAKSYFQKDYCKIWFKTPLRAIRRYLTYAP
jgi:hypothetical protein